MLSENEILELCERATPGPWFECDLRPLSSKPTIRDIYVSCSWPDFIGVASMENGLTATPEEALANATFIATARTAMPALIARVRELEAEVARLSTGLHRIVNCQSPLTRAQVREACAEIVFNKTSHLPDQSPFVERALQAEAALQAERARSAALVEERQAIITLLYTDEVFVGSDWVDFPNAEKGVWPALCAHTSSYGADAEKIPPSEYVPLAKMVEKHGREAVEAWVCFKRNINKPQKGDLTDVQRSALAEFRARALAAAEGGCHAVAAGRTAEMSDHG